MTIDMIIEVLKAVINGKTGLIDAVHANPLLILIPFIMALLACAQYFIRMPGGPRIGSAAVCFLLAGAMALVLISGPTVKTAQQQPREQPRAAQPTFRVLVDHTLLSNSRMLVTQFKTGTADECQKVCAGRSDCPGYVYDVDTSACSLRSDVGNPMRFSGSIVGIRKP